MKAFHKQKKKRMITEVRRMGTSQIQDRLIHLTARVVLAKVEKPKREAMAKETGVI